MLDSSTPDTADFATHALHMRSNWCLRLHHWSPSDNATRSAAGFDTAPMSVADGLLSGRAQMKLRVDEQGITVGLDTGAEIAVYDYDASVIDGLAGELADGATFECVDGCSVTRRGGQAIWYTPPSAT